MTMEHERRSASGQHDALRQNEEKYRTLFDTIDEGFCICEVSFGADDAVVEMRYLDVNPAFARHTGLHDVIGKSSRELFPNLESHWLLAATRVMRTGRPERIENHQADLDRWFDLQYSRVGGAGSRLLAVVLADVTERKRIEITANRLASIVEGSDDAIIGKNLDGIIETWNGGAERIFGYTANDVIGKPVTVLMPPDRVDEEPGILARLRSGERVDHFETVRRRKDGSLIDVALTISPIRDGDGNIVGASKIAHDVSQRKQVDRVLRESQQRFQALFAASPASFLILRPDAPRFTIVEVNDAYLRATMRTREELIGRGVFEAFPDNPDDPSIEGVGSLRASFERVLASRQPDTLPDLKYDVARTDGTFEERWWTPVNSAVLDENGNVEAIIHNANDVTDHHRAAAALRESRAQLHRANRAKDEFIAMLGHELRNPLAPITTTLQLMKLRAPDVLTRERGVIEAQVQHLTGLVNDLLDVARIATGKVELDSERVDVDGIVAAAVETTQPAMESSRQTLHVHVEEGLAVSGDRRRLMQVLVNLLGNAAKYSPPDRNVWLSAEAEDGQMVLRVRDEGQGIAPDLLPRIFESFIQDERALDRSRGGLGLGLAIVRSLVLLHGGGVTAASDGAYKGSEFTVRLPLLDRPHTASAIGENAPLPRAATAPVERIRVLVVDDYAPAAENLALLLQEMGYRTAVANDGAAALATMQTFHPQLGLVDIGLPVIDGYEVAQTVRRTPGFEHLPLVAITGYGQPSDRARAMDAGFNEHLVKPLDAVHISELIERLVAGGAVTALWDS